MPPFPASPQMALALTEARAAAARGEVPIGAVVSGPDGTILAAAGNRTLELRDPTAHAELLAIRAACAALGSERLPGCTLHVTLEPCPMCASAISQARIATLVYGASDPKSGGIEQGPRVFTHPQSHHVPEVVAGISASESTELLKAFFKSLRREGV
jgi:tRNA(adenine34) deaminase